MSVAGYPSPLSARPASIERGQPSPNLLHQSHPRIGQLNKIISCQSHCADYQRSQLLHPAPRNRGVRLPPHISACASSGPAGTAMKHPSSAKAPMFCPSVLRAREQSIPKPTRLPPPAPTAAHSKSSPPGRAAVMGCRTPRGPLLPQLAGVVPFAQVSRRPLRSLASASSRSLRQFDPRKSRNVAV